MNKDSNETRDRVVGDALRDIPVPARSPDFFVRLREKAAPDEHDIALMHGPQQASGRGTSATEHWSRRVALLAPTALLSAALGGVVGASVYAETGTQSPLAATSCPEETRSPTPTPTASASVDEPSPSPTTQKTNGDVIYFEPSEGWNTVQTSVGSDPEAPNAAWAANVPYASEESYSGFPDNTLRCMPDDGIVMVAVGPRTYTGGVDFPHLEMPLRLSDGFFVPDQYNGQPATHVSMYTIDTWIDGKLLNVNVWIGQNHPSPDLVRAANQELARLRVP